MTIGLGVVLVALEGLWLKTKNDLYHKQANSGQNLRHYLCLGVAPAS